MFACTSSKTSTRIITTLSQGGRNTMHIALVDVLQMVTDAWYSSDPMGSLCHKLFHKVLVMSQMITIAARKRLQTRLELAAVTVMVE